MPGNEKRGITVKVGADLHAEIRSYLEAHDMTMGEFISLAAENTLHPKFQVKESATMENARTLAFQVPEELFQRIKDYLRRNGMTQKQLIDLAPAAVEYAKNRDKNLYAAEAGDARKLRQPDRSADAVLLMGPLYHLQTREDRYAVLREACRVLKPGGLLFAAGISKFSSATWALSVYGEERPFLDDDIYMDMILGEMRTGEHNRPAKYPNFIANAYFHTSDQLREEIGSSGFEILATHAVEGCIWFVPDLNAKWENKSSRERLLTVLHETEQEETLMGMSPHFMVVAKR